MKRLKVLLPAVGVMSLVMVGCGGGGGDSSTPPQEYTYNIQNLIDTASYNIDFQGNMNLQGETISLTATTQSEYIGTDTIEDGTEVHLHEGIVIIEGGGINIFQETSSITYQGYSVYTYQEGVECITTLKADNIGSTPTDAKVGYISSVIPLECTDGTYQEYIVKLEEGEGDKANLNLLLNMYDHKGGTLTTSSKSIYTVDPNMNVSNVEISANYLSLGGSMLLNSTSIEQY